MNRYYEFNTVKYKAVSCISGKNVKGVINFEQLQNNIVVVVGSILGLPKGSHNLIIHEYGDESNGIVNVGNEYCILGSIYSNKYGISNVYIVNGKISICGYNSILGRSVLIYNNKNDFDKKNNDIPLGLIGICTIP
ncbi:superoxide dismutase-like protein [Cotia virus SPAn232]|uniref:Superoxide dismutase-like protein n=2 Tax=Cotia virus TaxID=39444 RepID=H6TAB6_9POXV|nr:superoxide dismutase-like protein [Cotia virus SPAn232]AFB76950.1 superoxide dismutase-like protein [Cotia virus SPAn232]AIT70763.1 superoxide dismutase-like protein [Cotia virus]